MTLSSSRVLRVGGFSGLCGSVGLLAALLVTQSAPAARTAGAAAKPVTTKITVTAGKPTEFAFKLSKTEVPVGTVVFTVHNAGVLGHSFKICTTAAKTTKANACVGKATAVIPPKHSATLTVKFTKKGNYEYLCTVPGHAAAGMKGKLGIGEVATAPTTTAAATTTTAPVTTTAAVTTTTAATTTTAIVKPPATEALIGDPTDGASVFVSAGCGQCHTLAAAGTTGTVGPNLDALAPDQPTIVNQVTGGGGFMPSFAASLSATQINDVASYVYQSTHS